MPFDSSGFSDDDADPTAPREALWVRYAIAVALTLAVAVLPAWSLCRVISSHDLWSF
jgi:hypothetical protein